MTEILIDTHCHTVASGHAYSTIKELAETAHEKGLLMIACTDHGPDLPHGTNPTHFSNLRCLPRFISNVAILRGIEGNISQNGQTDCNPYMRKFLDIVMAGLHAPIYENSHSKVQNTDTLLRVITSGKVDVITHPANKAYPIDIKVVALAAAEFQVALEINASQNTRRGSEDMAQQLASVAYQCGAPLTIGSDAHYCADVGNFKLAYEILDKAGIERDYVLNSSPLKLLKFLQNKKRKCDDLIEHFQNQQTLN